MSIPDFADAIDPNADHNRRRPHDASLEAVIRAAALATLRYNVKKPHAYAEEIAHNVVEVLRLRERTYQQLGRLPPETPEAVIARVLARYEQHRLATGGDIQAEAIAEMMDWLRRAQP